MSRSFGTPGHVDGSVGFPTTLFFPPSNNTWQHLSITIWGSACNSPHPPFLCAVAKTGSVANPSPAPRLAVPASWLTTPAPEAWLQSPAGGTFLEELFSSKVNMFHFCISVFSLHAFSHRSVLTFLPASDRTRVYSRDTVQGTDTSAAPVLCTRPRNRTHLPGPSLLELLPITAPHKGNHNPDF